MNSDELIKIAIGTVCLIAAGDLAFVGASRNQYGNPESETLLSSCELPSGRVARLYQGNGGATTGYWYTATVAGPSDSPEKQIFYSYRAPAFSTVQCGISGIEMDGASHQHISAEELPKLAAQPLAYHDGALMEPSRRMRLLSDTWPLSLMLGAMGLVMLWSPIRRIIGNDRGGAL